MKFEVLIITMAVFFGIHKLSAQIQKDTVPYEPIE
jgi:hypothetical protein